MPAESPLSRLERQLTEACAALGGQVVDPREAYGDGDEPWLPLGSAAEMPGGAPYTTESELFAIQARCRRLAVSNEFAVNGHENRISYIVGTGHTYRAVARRGQSPPAALVRQVQEAVDQFLRDNRWYARQEEIVRRRDRDGEVFLRFFPQADGGLAVRFVEPGRVRTPPREQDNPSASFGILHAAGDVETPRLYFIDGEAVAAAEVQHRKANVDANSKRGLPLFYPVLDNLRRAEKLLRNMSSVAEIQSAIALIRRHTGGNRGTVEQFVRQSADAVGTDPAAGRRESLRRYGPGTILDAPAGLEYDFPAAGIEARQFVEILQAELRAIASRLVLPEFMLTSDASNANYSSTLIAEGPAMKLFARLQTEMIEEDRQVFERLLRQGVRSGRLPADAAAQVELRIAAPSLKVRDERQEAEIHRLEHAAGILSPQTWSQLRGLDYEQEQQNRRAAGERD